MAERMLHQEADGIDEMTVTTDFKVKDANDLI